MLTLLWKIHCISEIATNFKCFPNSQSSPSRSLRVCPNSHPQWEKCLDPRWHTIWQGNWSFSHRWCYQPACILNWCVCSPLKRFSRKVSVKSLTSSMDFFFSKHCKVLKEGWPPLPQIPLPSHVRLLRWGPLASLTSWGGVRVPPWEAVLGAGRSEREVGKLGVGPPAVWRQLPRVLGGRCSPQRVPVMRECGFAGSPEFGREARNIIYVCMYVCAYIYTHTTYIHTFIYISYKSFWSLNVMLKNNFPKQHTDQHCLEQTAFVGCEFTIANSASYSNQQDD